MRFARLPACCHAACIQPIRLEQSLWCPIAWLTADLVPGSVPPLPLPSSNCNWAEALSRTIHPIESAALTVHHRDQARQKSSPSSSSVGPSSPLPGASLFFAAQRCRVSVCKVQVSTESTLQAASRIVPFIASVRGKPRYSPSRRKIHSWHTDG